MFKPRKAGWSNHGWRELRESEGNCVKYLGSGTEKRGGEVKILKKRGGQAELMGEFFKKGGI